MTIQACLRQFNLSWPHYKQGSADTALVAQPAQKHFVRLDTCLCGSTKPGSSALPYKQMSSLTKYSTPRGGEGGGGGGGGGGGFATSAVSGERYL